MGANTIQGGAGDDVIEGKASADILDGGTGSDTVSYNSSRAAVTVSLTNNSVSGGDATGDIISNFENIIGSSNADTLTGDANPNNIQGGAGNDVIEGKAGADILDGGMGADTASYASSIEAVAVSLSTGIGSGGDAQGDTLISIENIIGSGNADTLTGDANINNIQGGADDDLIEGMAGADVLDGGSGTDTVSYASSTSAVAVSLAKGSGTVGDASGDIISNFENIIGSVYADTLIGDGNANNIQGSAGDDVIEGKAGADSLDGETGSDTLSYASSTGAVTISLATNTVSGGDAAGDAISNFENIIGSVNADTLTGDVNANTIRGGAGNDIIEGLDGADILDGGAGIDTLSYASSAVAVTVSLATNTVSGGDAIGDVITSFENIIGSLDADTLTGDINENNIQGGSGDDIIEGKAGADILDGEIGIDTVSYASSPAAVTVSLATGTAAGGDAAGDTIINFENIIGSGNADILTGDINSNNIQGGAGDDIIEGMAGADVLDGGTGIDTVSYASSTGAVTISLATNTVSRGDATGDVIISFENIIGSADADILTGDGYANNIQGGAGNDLIEGKAGADILDGGAGIDVAVYSSSSAGITVDLSLGSGYGGEAEKDKLTNIENLIGSAYNDNLIGDSNANTLEGREGNDTLEGRGGNDILIGGKGTDTFIISAQNGATTIDDFEPYQNEKIDIRAFSTSIKRLSDLEMQDNINGAEINLDNDHRIVLNNVKVTELEEKNFIFRTDQPEESITDGPIFDGIIAPLIVTGITAFSAAICGICKYRLQDNRQVSHQPPSANQNQNQAPIGISLSDTKIGLINLSTSTILFDYNDKGVKNPTAWVDAQDAFLIYDHNDNKQVDAARELVLTQWSETATTDFVALKEVFDSNKDNKFDAKDTEFNKFMVWQDKNQDGVSQSDELASLLEAGLVQVDFNTEKTVNDEFFGKQQDMNIAEVLWANGYKTLAYDLALETSDGI